MTQKIEVEERDGGSSDRLQAGSSAAVSPARLGGEGPLSIGDLVAVICSDLGATRSAPRREPDRVTGAKVLRFAARKPSVRPHRR